MAEDYCALNTRRWKQDIVNLIFHTGMFLYIFIFSMIFYVLYKTGQISTPLYTHIQRIISRQPMLVNSNGHENGSRNNTSTVIKNMDTMYNRPMLALLSTIPRMQCHHFGNSSWDVISQAQVITGKVLRAGILRHFLKLLVSASFGPASSAASAWSDPWKHIQSHSPSQSPQTHSVAPFPPSVSWKIRIMSLLLPLNYMHQEFSLSGEWLRSAPIIPGKDNSSTTK